MIQERSQFLISSSWPVQSSKTPKMHTQTIGIPPTTPPPPPPQKKKKKPKTKTMIGCIYRMYDFGSSDKSIVAYPDPRNRSTLCNTLGVSDHHDLQGKAAAFHTTHHRSWCEGDAKSSSLQVCAMKGPCRLVKSPKFFKHNIHMTNKISQLWRLE
jgi:hypothetical protein